MSVQVSEKSYYLKIAGANFEGTIFDTEDLSCIRGSSMAMLESPDLIVKQLEKLESIVGIDRIFSGASIALLLIQTKMSREEIEVEVRGCIDKLCKDSKLEERLRAAIAHLYFNITAYPANGPDSFLRDMDGLDRRESFNRSTNLITPLPKYNEESKSFCKSDKLRPRLQNREVSESVYARKEYGKLVKTRFFSKIVPELVDDIVYQLANEFSEIRPNPLIPVSYSAKNKIAVLFMDGNEFGKKRRLIWEADKRKGASEFSNQLEEMRKRFLTRVFKYIQYQPLAVRTIRADGKEKNLISIETLLWGGDEMMFVLPSCLAFDLLAQIGEFLDAEAQRKPAHGEKDYTSGLTFACGLVVCNYKTPIREAKRLAEELAYSAKQITDRKLSAFQYMILESVDPPDEDFDCRYQKLLNLSNSTNNKQLLKGMTLRLDGNLGKLISRLVEWKGTDKEESYESKSVRMKRLNKAIKERQTLEALNEYVSTVKGIDAPEFGKSLVAQEAMPIACLWHSLQMHDYIGYSQGNATAAQQTDNQAKLSHGREQGGQER